MTDDTDSTHDLAERIADSVRSQTTERSRRSFLGRSALAGGTLLALGGGAGMTLAQDEDDEMDAEELTANFDDVEGTDIDVLNYALTLEHLEDAFYEEALEMFSEDDFVNADSLQSFSEETRSAAYGYLQTVGEHESTHVDVLTQAVELLGGTPAERGSYNFGLESIEDFISLGQAFENTGVAAYAGAAPFVQSPDLLGVALSIHSVEARHAAVLNHLAGESPFPGAFDEAQSQSEVLDAVSGFIESDSEPDGDDADEDEDEATDTPEETETDTAEETETDDGTDTPEETDAGTATDTAEGTDTDTGDGTATESGA